jgi:CIC family chloride channel protein
VGIVAGAGALLFNYLLHIVSHHTLHGLMGLDAPSVLKELSDHQPMVKSHVDGFLVVLLPTLGGLFSGILCYRWAPEAMGHGTDGAINAFHRLGGKVRWQVPPIKLLATIFTLGLGGSGGGEGPIAQIGSGAGSLLGQWLKLGPRRTRILLVAGMAAGIGALFEAPLATTIFAGEILYRGADIDGEVLVPSAIASVVAYSIYVGAMSFLSGVVRWSHMFVVPHWTFLSGFELIGYSILALVCGMAAKLWIKIFYGVHHGVDRLKIPLWVKPTIGGFLTGIVAFMTLGILGGKLTPALLTGGYGYLQLALTTKLSLTFLLTLFFLKMLVTAFSIGSGGSGGVFGPSLVLGGALGGAVGLSLQALHPALVVDPGTYALVGMAALFGAAAHAPICSVVMVTEITKSYGLLVPSIWVCFLAFLMVGEKSLYNKQVQHIEDSPAHQLEMRWNILNDLYCKDWMTKKVAFFRDSDTFEQIEQGLLKHRAHDKFPVLDTKDKAVGILSIKKLREVFGDPELREVAIAGDAMDPLTLVDFRNTPLSQAYDHLVSNDASLLCIAEDQDNLKLAGILTRRDILLAYNHEMTRRRKNWEEF